MLDSRLKDPCRICGRELCGNQRRWIFHPTAKLNLQVLLSHALGRELTRDGRGEFVCGKCAFVLERMYRFDTVIARVEALSIERLHKLLQEKERLRHGVGSLYWRNNEAEDRDAVGSHTPDTAALSDATYSSLVQEDLTFSVFEHWSELESSQHALHHHHPQSRKCRGCAALRVADSDYEAVCGVPRKVSGATSCGPSTQQLSGGEEASNTDHGPEPENLLSPASSTESLDALDETEGEQPLPEHLDSTQKTGEGVSVLEPDDVCVSGLDLALSLVRSLEYHPLRTSRGSRLPVRIKPEAPTLQLDQTRYSGGPGSSEERSSQRELHQELADMEELWLDEFMTCGPFPPQKALIEEQQTRLVGQQQVRPLQARIRESEASNKELQRRMAEMQCELRSAREAAQLQDGAIQTLRDTLSTSRAQVSDLQQVVMEQKEMLVSLKSQGQQEQQGGVLALEASLFSSQLEMQHCQQALSHAHRREDDLTRANQRLHSDLQRAEQQREQAERHSQDLLCAVEDARTRLVQLEDGMKEKEGERGGENTIRQLRNTLQNKERLLQDYSQMLDSGGKECVPSKLKLRIQERDCAVEQALDELRKLQLHLREKERDLEKLQCVCANNEETIMSLQALLRARDLEQEQVCVSLRNVQGVHRECEDRHKHTLLERDMLINQLQSCLHTFTKENKDLTSALISGQSVESASLLEELKTHLCVKEKLIQDLLSDRSRQVQQHQTQMQDMLNAIGSRDQYIQDAAGRAGEMIGAQTARLQEMRRQLACAQATEGPGDPHDDVDVQALQEELQLAVRRERLAQQQLSTLRASLAQQDEQLQLQPALTPHFKGMTEKGPTCLTAVESDAASQSRAEFGEVDNAEDYSSDFVEEEENSKMTVKVLGATQGCVAPQTPQNSAVEEVKFLVEQKREVEKELMELRALLQRSGYSSLSEMKRALSSLHAENQELRDLLTQAQQRKEKPSRSQNGELCERAVQPEALQPSRDLAGSSAPLQHSKHVQVDLQDLGYETSGRSENEVEREETSSPEFDDLEMCTSLSLRDSAALSLWGSSSGAAAQHCGKSDVVMQLQTRPRDHEEDEGWQSSSDAHWASPAKSGTERELRELVCRVESLEEQLRAKGKGHSDGGKATNIPGVVVVRRGCVSLRRRFDSLIQAQARELCVLRGRVREGACVCRLLSRQLADTTKAFEELLRATDVDYYMGQSFREQLSQSGALAHRAYAKISGEDPTDLPDEGDKTELLAIRLSKELQQKDKLIESLRSKLDQSRPHTPTSSHGPSDHSDRISFVSDEPGSITEDLDMGTPSEYGPEERLSTGTDVMGSGVKPHPGTPLATPPQLDLPGLLPFSQHPHHQSPFVGLNYSPGAGLLESSALWDTLYGPRPIRAGVYGDVSSGSSGYQSGTSHTGAELMEEHLREIRCLRRRLEDSIQTNDRLRQQLEERLTSLSREGGAPTNIYIQGLDSVPQLSNQIHALKEENRALQTCLAQTTRESSKEAELLRETVMGGRGRLKEAELEVERLAEQCKRLQAAAREKTRSIQQLREDKQSSQENANRLQHEVDVLQQQLSETRRLVQCLQDHIWKQQRLGGSDTQTNTAVPGTKSFSPTFDLGSLHIQLQHLQTPGHPGRQLFHDPSPSPPVRDTCPQSPAELRSPESTAGERSPVALLLGTADPFFNPGGRHVIGHTDDYNSVLQQLLEASVLLAEIERTLQQTLVQGGRRNLMGSTTTLRQILEEATSLLRTFWRAALPGEASQDEEMTSLKRKLSQQQRALQDALENLRSSNQTRNTMENFIVSQLSRTRDVLKKARSNLEKNQVKISSLSLSPSSPSSCPSSSSLPWWSAGKNAGLWTSSPGQRVLSRPQSQHPLQASSY
ncbi:myomegalin-like isoform X5 [Denticeps clupeoides]|uniref:myomegalin-like isoform X5 n=1 Tax=Denticeps clupeoides TaxID=299321 RepID=UPI0010A2DCE8|nr:myomegalin-like isoform X5 [Denticeps clupeoides]